MLSKEMESLFFQIRNITKGNSKMTKLMAEANLLPKMEKLYQAFGKILDLLKNFDIFINVRFFYT
jgi:predicted transcriptional regulator